MKTKIQSTLNIAQDALHGGEVWLSRVMHVKTDLLDGVGNIRTREGEVLKGASNAAIVCRVGGSDTISGELGVSIHRGTAGLAVEHTNTFQNIQHILTLGEK